MLANCTRSGLKCYVHLHKTESEGERLESAQEVIGRCWGEYQLQIAVRSMEMHLTDQMIYQLNSLLVKFECISTILILGSDLILILAFTGISVDYFPTEYSQTRTVLTWGNAWRQWQLLKLIRFNEYVPF